MDSMDMGFLPTIKCSNCGCNVDISSMGDHTCSRNDFAPVAPIPSPPPSAGFDSDRFAEAKVSRGPPLAIDPSAANRAFLQPNVPTPVSSVHMSSPLPANPAPASTVVRPSTHSLTDDSVFSFPMPGNRSPTEVRTQSTMMAQTASKSQSPVSSSGQAVALKPENVQLPPSPMPSKSPDTNHQREESVSSFASSRYGNSTTRSSVNSVSQGFRSIMDDTPPVPPAPLRTSKKNSVHRDSDVSVVPSPISKEEASGFDFGILRGQSPTSGPQALPEEPSSAQFQDQTQYVAFNPVHLHPVTEETEPGSDAPRKSSNASMTSVFSVTSFARALGLDDQMNSSESSGSDSSYSDARSGSSMSSLPSVASFNRYKPTDPLNLKHLAHTRQTVLEIPGHIRSSVEGVPHMPAALFSPDSPTDPSINRGGVSLIAERKEVLPTPTPIQPKQPTAPKSPTQPRQSIPPNSPTQPRQSIPPKSPTQPRQSFPPKSPTQPKQSIPPNSPTQPKQSIPPNSPTQRKQSIPPKSPTQPRQSVRSKSPTQPKEPVPPKSPTQTTPTRSGTRSKGRCKGCNETITGKSVSSSDGRLTGRYHRGCFVCFECHSPFQTADFYVLNNRPFCAQHYHERNGSLCAGCNTGIEGHYLETVERNPARPDRRRFHTHCLQCRTCHVLLKGDYFEWNGEVFCERDARRAAAASHPPPPGPPGRRRPNLPPSPLAQSGQFSPGPYPMPGGRLGPAHGPGLHPGSRFPTGGGGRFPERRTTRLMMI